MMESQGLQVLRCKQCNKPFDKPSTLKRHGYYCRSRNSAKAVRRRSCNGCASAKGRCDGGKPACSRCQAKGLVCQWPDPLNPRVQSIAHTTLTSHDSLYNVSSNAPSRLGCCDITGAAQIHDFDTVIWPAQDFWIDPSNMLQPSSLPNFDPIAIPVDVQLSTLPPTLASSTSFTIPQSPTAMTRTLIPRSTNTTPSFQRTSRLIMSTLKSYAAGFIKHHTLPPFIHPRMLSLDIELPDSIEPLHTCLNLAQLSGPGRPGGRKLFWRNVKMECERFTQAKPTHKSCPWELLATMQALTMYLLIRLHEGETEGNLDALLVNAVIVVSLQLHQTDKDQCNALSKCESCRNGSKQSWEAWILRESRRRLAVLYRIIAMLLYFEPASICNLPTNLLIAPLPARKELWEAMDEEGWEARTNSRQSAYGPPVWRCLGGEDTDEVENCSYGMTADGELIRLGETKSPAGSRCADRWMAFKDSKEAVKSMPANSVARWEDWCADMDAFGGFILLAASLVA